MWGRMSTMSKAAVFCVKIAKSKENIHSLLIFKEMEVVHGAEMVQAVVYPDSKVKATFLFPDGSRIVSEHLPASGMLASPVNLFRVVLR